MARKPNNTDDLMFDNSDEFFPLDNGSTRSDKGSPPKGLKGYLKNVVKSVRNLSVSVTKEMYPEAFNLANSIKEDQGEGQNINIKETVSKYKGYLHEAKSEIKDIAKDIGKGAKDAIRTGYFVKSEEESNDMSDAFGDMFGDDFNFDDFGSGDTADFGEDDDFDNDGESTGSGRINTGDAVIRSSAASTKALLHASNKQSSIIIGATQSQIKHETKLFAQQILIEQEHHKDKMRVLSNIAKNIAKTVNQNNISIKAQMEYSLKSLAFTQDMNAMLKEIRDAQWALTRPKEEEETDRRSTRQKVFGQFGDQLGLSHWINHIKDQMGGGPLSMVGQMYDGYKMMTDMGMGKGKAAMQLLGPMIMGQMIESMSSSSQIQSRNLLNKKIAGLPRQLNQILGHIASGDGKIGSWLSEKSGKGGPMGWIAQQLMGFAGKAHIEDDMVYSTDRYNISNRMKDVHPFDNHAHKALTEVIPEFLSRISAGVNHTEQETFDYTTNKMVKRSYFAKLQEEMHKDTIEQTANYFDSQEKFVSAASRVRESKDYQRVISQIKKETKDGKDFKGNRYINADYTPNTDALEDLYPKLLENWMMEELPLFEGAFKQVQYTYNEKGELKPGNYSDIILRNVTDATDDYSRFIICNSFYDFLHTWASDPSARDSWVEFVLDVQNYKSRASQANMDFEDRVAMTSSAGLSEDIMYTKQSETNRKNVLGKIEKIKKRIDSTSGKERLKLEKQMDEYKLQLHNINRNASVFGGDGGIDSQISSVNGAFKSTGEKDEDTFESYRLASLEDSSTHGVVKNIYNLLLSGIDVYTRPASDRNEKDQKFLNDARQKGGSRLREEKKAKKTAEGELRYEQLYSGYDNIEDFKRANDLIDEKGKVIYKGHLYYCGENGDYEELDGGVNAITLDDAKGTIHGRVLYVKSSEKRAHDSELRRTTAIRSKKHDEENGYRSPLEKIPVIGPFVKMFNDANEKFANIGNRVLGEGFYGELYNEEGDKGMKGSVKDGINGIKSDIKSGVRSTISDVTSGAAKEYLSNKLMGIKVGDKTLGETIAESKDSVLLAKLKENKSNPIEEAKILIDYAKNNEKIQKFITPLADFVKNNEKLMTAASSISGMMKYVKSKIVDKAMNKLKSGANKLFGKVMTGKLGKEIYAIKVDGKTFKDALTDYYTKNPGIKDANVAKALAFEKTPDAKDSKAVAKFLKETFTKIDDPEIEKYKPEIIRICEDYQSGAKSTIGGAIKAGAKRIFNKITDWFKRKIMSKFKLTDNKKLIPEDMNNIESVDGRKLGDVIANIAEQEGITDILKNIPTGPAKAEFLIHNDSPDLAGFKAGLRKYQKEAISGKAKDVAENVKEKFGAAAAFAKDAFNKTANAFKDDESEEGESENEEEDEDGEYHTKGKKKRKRHRRNRDKKKKTNNRADDDGVEGNSAAEMKEAKESKIKQDKQDQLNKNIERMANSIETIQKDGMGFNKDAKKHITDANDNAAFKSEMKNGEGVLGTIKTFIDKTGLGNTKLGSALSKSTDAVGGLLDKAGDVANMFGAKGKVVGTIAKTLAKTGLGKGIASVAGGAVSSIVGGVAGGGGGLVSAGLGVAKTLATGGLKGAIGVVKTALSKFFNAGPIKKWFKGGVVNTIKNNFAKFIAKFAPKLGAKIAAMSAAAATVVVAIGTAVVGFGKGMIKAKEYFKVGKGMRITVGMRLAAGLADALDMLLFGIPGLIAGWLGKANCATWLYEYVGGDAEKMALERYQEYNKKRAEVFGISDPLALVAYENRSQGEGIGGKLKTAVLHGGRKLLNLLSWGLVDDNDTKDAKMLGFKTEKIFKAWREKKYKPLDEMRETIATQMGVKLSDMEDVTAVDPREVDADQDNQVDNNQKAQEEMQKLELQTKYRVTYLEACRKYVLSNHIAWLTSRCTPEQYAKYSGESAGEEFATSAGKKMLNHIMKPIGALKAAFDKGKSMAKTAYTATANFTGNLIADPKGTITQAGNKVTNWLKHIFERYKMNDNEQKLMNIAGNEIANVNLGASPNFYGDDPTGEKNAGYQQYAVNHGNASATPSGEDTVSAGGSGASTGGFEGYYMKVKNKNMKPKTNPSPSGVAQSGEMSTMDSSTNVTPPPAKATIKNSRTDDFAGNFGKEICNKLSILEEMQKENIRHNEVSEKFFSAALEMLATIAANSNNRGISDKFASMLNSVSRF